MSYSRHKMIILQQKAISSELIGKHFFQFSRMKREVASSLVERGVAERVRLTQVFDRKTSELQLQHDNVKTALNEHKEKVSSDSSEFK